MGVLGWGGQDESPTDGFSDKEVGNTCVGCGEAEKLSDMDLDGVIMGQKDGACVPITKKDETLTRATIQKAKGQAFSSSSACCKSKYPPNGVADKTIVYVNGIRTKQGGHCQTLQDVADTTCAKVIGVYNATRNAVADLWQAKRDKSWINKHAKDKEKEGNDQEKPRMSPAGRNPAVDTLRDMIYAEASSDQEMEIFAHSQGGAITSVALYEAEKQLAGVGMEENLSKVTVTSMGSAAQKWPDGPNYTHLIHARDFTPVNLGLGRNAKDDASDAGENAKVIRFVGEPSDNAFTPMEPGAKTGRSDFTKYHDVDGTYLKAQDQFNNGCRGKP